MHGEFWYEKEIRLDEERIARYFDNIPVFIDLPGENDAVLERIRVGNEKYHKCTSLEQLRSLSPGWNFADDEDSEDEYDHADSVFPYPGEGDVLDMLDEVAVFCSDKFALSDDPELNSEYLNIVCQCGKTIARIYDLLSAAEKDTGMRTALAKRSLHDLNDLAGMIIKSGVGDIQCELDVLQTVRSKVLDMLLELEKN